ncbi:complex I NDUFA9 subunit family protein [Bradyrhizobium sp.]|uniref:complex I NDUFA9 subunit family protein n=1 Tax=Bradyrhizobium sp. TaxID=376 RepID=UPI0025BB1484|nr:complex I NDUFA9 subunit family protein [Bradyrhizobium sp.]
MLKHLLFDVIGHFSGLSEAQLEQIERSLPATKALIELLDKARPLIEQAEKLYVEAEPLIEEARKEWQTVGPAAQLLLDVVSHHLSKGRSPAETTETVRAALGGTIQGGPIETIAQNRGMDRGMNRVTVFGGTGFVGRRIARDLSASAKVRIASRHPAPTERDNIEQLLADAHDERAVEAAIEGADGVVNAISLYVEHGGDTFHSVHVEAAANIAKVARRVGVKRLVHLSGIGADPTSASPYIRSRGEGEAAVQAAFPGAVIVRPAVMFAADDAFLTTILRLLRALPAYPLFGNGRTRLQPVYADDVAAAIGQILRQPQRPYPVYELAGPRVYAYEELLRSIARIAGLRPVLVRTPFSFWGAAAGLAEILPHPPLTRNQVELMQIDTTASDGRPGFGQLGMSPRSLEDELKAMLKPANGEAKARPGSRPSASSGTR